MSVLPNSSEMMLKKNPGKVLSFRILLVEAIWLFVGLLVGFGDIGGIKMK